MGAMLDKFGDLPEVGLVSLMDHTPGQRQWRDMEAYAAYYGNKAASESLGERLAEIVRNRELHGPGHLKRAAELAKRRGLPLASHDDATEEHVQEALALGAAISEFPTTMEAARAAARLGLGVAMGAPNLVRGGSHSGNVAASEVAEAGLLSALSSDYVPASLVSGAFALFRDHGWSLPEALRTVTETPARLGGLSDRGRLEPGRRADLVRIAKDGGRRPVVRSVWVAGRRVF
jgi:alpha-D-ribose 1-methylphosphonate 5-triphosphate diphosphatase